MLDLVVIAAIIKSPLALELGKAPSRAAGEAPAEVLASLPAALQPLAQHLPGLAVSAPAILALAAYFLYGAIFVGISGQTLGMMIMDLRVVTTRYVRPSPAQAFWRYAAALGSLLTALALIGCFVRVHPHDRLSRTRVVLGRRVV